MSARTGTKHARVAVRQLLRGGLGERGFTALAGERFVVGAGWVEPPLQLEVSAPVEGHRYGGVVVTFFAKIVSEAVRVFFDASVPKAAMNAVYDRDGAVVNPPLEFVMPGELVRSDGVGGAFDWVVEDQDQAPAVVGELLAVVDGALRSWVWPRRDVEVLLRTAAAAPDGGSSHARPLAVLALLQDRPDFARAIMAAARRSPRRDDTPERFDAFDAVLRLHFTDYAG